MLEVYRFESTMLNGNGMCMFNPETEKFAGYLSLSSEETDKTRFIHGVYIPKKGRLFFNIHSSSDMESVYIFDDIHNEGDWINCNSKEFLKTPPIDLKNIVLIDAIKNEHFVQDIKYVLQNFILSVKNEYLKQQIINFL